MCPHDDEIWLDRAGRPQDAVERSPENGHRPEFRTAQFGHGADLFGENSFSFLHSTWIKSLG